MPRSRGRKKPKQKAQNQLPRQQLDRPSLHQRFLGWLQATRLHQLEFSVSLIVGLVAVGGWIYDAFREPEIHANIGSIESPFELRFSLRNPSFLFEMKSTKMLCEVTEINLSQWRIAGFSFSDGSTVSILPRQTIQYSCPFEKIIGHPGMPVISANIKISTKFETLLFNRESRSDRFSWNAQSKHWIEGEIIN